MAGLSRHGLVNNQRAHSVAEPRRAAYCLLPPAHGFEFPGFRVRVLRCPYTGRSNGGRVPAASSPVRPFGQVASTGREGDSGGIPNCAGTSSQGSSEVGLRSSGSVGAADFSVRFVHENREAFLFKMMVIRQYFGD